MPIQARWYNDERTIILYQMSGQLTLDDFTNMMQLGYDMREQVEHIVHGIIDVTQATGRLPKGLIAHYPQLAQMPHPRVGMSIYVHPSRMAHTFTDIYSRLFGTVYVAPSIDDALTMIARYQARYTS
ncbi:MAG: hypothetical protein GYB68_13610 [Chloroflexi bacterium]|nr:hypothetical protein [Chloroflexota bacterium]